jgi:hypothetical protein
VATDHAAHHANAVRFDRALDHSVKSDVPLVSRLPGHGIRSIDGVDRSSALGRSVVRRRGSCPDHGFAHPRERSALRLSRHVSRPNRNGFRDLCAQNERATGQRKKLDTLHRFDFDVEPSRANGLESTSSWHAVRREHAGISRGCPRHGRPDALKRWPETGIGVFPVKRSIRTDCRRAIWSGGVVRFRRVHTSEARTPVGVRACGFLFGAGKEDKPEELVLCRVIYGRCLFRLHLRFCHHYR